MTTISSDDFRSASAEEKRHYLHGFWNELRSSEEKPNINLDCVGDVAMLFYERVFSDVSDSDDRSDAMGAIFVHRYECSDCRKCQQFPGECPPYSRLKEVWKH